MSNLEAEKRPEPSLVEALLQNLLSHAEPIAEVIEVNTADGQLAQEMRQSAILALTGHSDPDLRREAAELLAEHQTQNALQTLLTLSQDSETEVRLQALTSLEQFELQDSFEALTQGLQDSDYLVRSTAAEVLGSQKNQRAVEALIQALKDPYYIVRATAAEALGNMAAFLASPALQDLLLDDDQWVRFSAAEALSQIEPEENVWPLLMELNSIDSGDQKTALKQLGDQIEKRAIPFLIKSFKTMPEHQTQILEVFACFHDPLVIPALVEVALFTEQPHLREMALIQAQQIDLDATLISLASWLDPDHLAYAQRAVESLIQLPSQQTTPLLHSALQLPDSWVRTVAMLSLQQRHEQVDFSLLKHLLKEQNPDLVQAALQNLLQYYPDLGNKLLGDFIDHKQAWRRKVVAASLHLLAGSLQMEIAGRLLQDPESDIREAGLKSLSQVFSDHFLALFIDGTKDSDSWVRLAAIDGLEQMPSMVSQTALILLLNEDADLMVRGRAAEALEKTSAQALVFTALLKSLQEDPSASVRKQVVHALFAAGQTLAPEIVKIMLQDADKNVCLTALHYLQKRPLRANAADIQKLLNAEDPQVKSAAGAANQALLADN